MPPPLPPRGEGVGFRRATAALLPTPQDITVFSRGSILGAAMATAVERVESGMVTVAASPVRNYDHLPPWMRRAAATGFKLAPPLGAALPGTLINYLWKQSMLQTEDDVVSDLRAFRIGWTAAVDPTVKNSNPGSYLDRIICTDEPLVFLTMMPGPNSDKVVSVHSIGRYTAPVLAGYDRISGLIIGLTGEVCAG